MKKFKSVISVIITLCATLSIAEEIEYSRSEYIDRLEMRPRTSMTGRPYVFPRILFKYGQFQNYLNWWVDRPLIMQRSLRYPTGSFTHFLKADFLQNTYPLVKKYDFDGMQCLPPPKQSGRMYEIICKSLEEIGAKDFFTLLQFYGGGGIDNKSYRYGYYDRITKVALASPNSFRVNGKVVISNYLAYWWKKPGNLKKLLDKLRKDNGDTFLFVADMGAQIARLTRGMERKGLKADQAPKAQLEKLKNEFRAWLDVADGLEFASASHTNCHSNSYDKKFSESIYRDVVIPAMLQVLNEPEYRDKKLLGLSASIGYTNFFSGANSSEMNTRRLRQSFESAISARPDYVTLPEWNEVNENTCIQPTVSNGWTTQRIFKYLMSFVNGQKPTPDEGDNLNIPNVAVSYRKTLKYGEVLAIELLNIPDSETSDNYTAQLTLKNINNKLVHKFPLETFTVKTMKDITYYIPTGQFASDVVLYPELTVTNPMGKSMRFSNLHYIRLHPTVCRDYQSVKQSLRDQLKPSQVDFTVVKVDGGKVEISGRFECNESLASVEALENEREVFAYDRLKEFDPNRDCVIYVEALAAGNEMLSGNITIEGTSEIYVRPIEHPNSDFTGLKTDGNVIKVNQRINQLHRSFYIRIPKKDASRTVLKCNLNGKIFKLPVKNLLKKRVFGLALNEKQTYLKISRVDTQPDIPVRINAKSAEFNFSAIPHRKYPVYSLRAISVSGKIYRSKAIMPFKPSPEPKVNLNVWDEFANKPVTIRVAKSRIPDLTYKYDPGNGDILGCKWGDLWNAEMGGGIKYGDTFHYRNSRYPRNAPAASPRKIKYADNRYHFEFDGKGTYITMPQEAFPRGPFTLSLDIKPRSEKPQVIFRHYGTFIGSLTLMLENGELVANFTDKTVKNHKFNTGLHIPFNKWSKLKVSYDYKILIFSVNGKSKSYPFSKRGFYFNPCVFGGQTRPDFGVRKGMNFFKGDIKDIRIVHNTE